MQDMRPTEHEWDPYYGPTTYYYASARVENDPNGRLGSGRAAILKAFSNDHLSFEDTMSIHLEPRDGDILPREFNFTI